MKITLYTSNVKNKNAILEATNIVKEWTKDILPLEFVIKETKATFTSMPFDNSASTNNGASSGYMVNPGDMVMLIDEKADITALIYDNSKMNPKPTNPVQNPWKLGNSTIIQMSEQWYNQLPDVCAMYLYHEIIHAMYFLLGKGGQDKVHYQHENPAFSQKQPYQWYQYLMISLLEDWKKYKGTETLEPDVVITRGKDNGVQTIGKLVAKRNGATFTCDTLELPWKNNERNVSCVPKGLYDVKYTFSWLFKKFTYELQKVLNRKGIRKHSGNYFTDIQGCILLGVSPKDINGDGQIDVTNSQNTVKAFEAFMGKKPYKLLIK